MLELQVSWEDDGLCRLWLGDTEVFLPHLQLFLESQQRKFQSMDEDSSDEEE